MRKLLNWFVRKPESRFTGKARRILVEDTTLRCNLAFDVDQHAQIQSVTIGDRRYTREFITRCEESLVVMGFDQHTHLIKHGVIVEPSIT